MQRKEITPIKIIALALSDARYQTSGYSPGLDDNQRLSISFLKPQFKLYISECKYAVNMAHLSIDDV